MKRGKRYVEAAKLVDRATLYDAADALAIVKKAAVAKFDETVELNAKPKSWYRYYGRNQSYQRDQSW